mmetsp:Transcript_18392/g.47104  ORF Transcript_18392/g.47104 Transcript_18392/m.47104 type:complete len:612 (-) Transcript_18392:202-2037(-)
MAPTITFKPRVSSQSLQGAIQAREHRHAEIRGSSRSTASSASLQAASSQKPVPDGEGAVWKTPKEIIPLEALLLPPDNAVRDSEYQLAVNEHCLSGWVEQQSPCCAAASVAGAFNALRHVNGKDKGAMQPDKVLPILQESVAADLAEKRVSTARSLCLSQPESGGAAALALLMCCVELLQIHKGKPLIGRKENTVITSELRLALREIAQSGANPSARALLPPDMRVSERDENALWQRLRRIYNVQAASRASAPSSLVTNTAAAPSDAPDAAIATPSAGATPVTTLASGALHPILPTPSAYEASSNCDPPMLAPTPTAVAPPSSPLPAAPSCSSGNPIVPGGGATRLGGSVRLVSLTRAGFERFGVRVGSDYPEGPPIITALHGIAAKGELCVGDTLLSIDGVEVTTAEAATAVFARVGTTIVMHVRRASGGSEAPLESRAAADDAAILKLLHAHIGHCKLACDAPSTAAIGNAHLLRAVSVLSAELSGLRIYSQRYCGVSREDDALTLSEGDSADTQVQQFQRLWSIFTSDDSVLLAHFWNHYAMIYAMRTYRDGKTGEKHHELLTAKPAQRPCRWISWSAMRSWLLQWVGYSIMRFDRVDGARGGVLVGR